MEIAEPGARPTSSPLRELGFTRLLAAIAAVSFVGAQVLHEAGHCLVGLLFGREPVWGVSSVVQLIEREPVRPDAWVRYLSPLGDEAWLRLASLPSTGAEWVVLLAAGPVLGLLGIALGLVVAHRATRQAARALGLLLALVNVFGLVTNYWLMALGGIGGDEALLAAYLDVPPSAVAAPLAAAAVAGLVLSFRALGSHRERLRVAVALPLAILPQGPLILLANRLVRDEVDAGNPLFAEVLGFSLPVLVGALAAAALAAWIVGTRMGRTLPGQAG